MAKEDIDKWANERLKTPDGKWINTPSPLETDDVLFCILCLMEDRSPDYYDANRLEEYVRLVEIGCEYIADQNKFDEGKKLWQRLQNDNKDLLCYQSLTSKQKLTELRIKVMFEGCFRKAHTCIFEQRII